MTKQQMNHWRDRIKVACTKYRMQDYVEDITGEIFLRFVDGRGAHSTINQMVIDCIRQRFGRPGNPTQRAKWALETSLTRSLTSQKPIRLYDDQDEFESKHLYELLSDKKLANQTQARIDVLKLLNKIPKHKALIIELYYFDGYSIYEIGEFFGVDGSRVFQLIERALEQLHEQTGRKGRGNK